MNAALHGVLPAIVTPMAPDGTFRQEPFERLLAHVYEAGVHGVYVCGQAGEGLLQSIEQRQRVVEVALQCSPPGKQVIIQVGASCTADAIRLAEHAATLGVTAVASLPPIGEYTFREIQLYYETLAAASPLPLLVYHHRGVCPLMTPEMALELCAIPNVIGLKFTDLDLFGLSVIRQHGHIVFNGRDEVLAAGLLMGAHGGVGAFYTVFPEAIVRIYELASQDRWAEAARIQRTLNQTFRQILQYPLVPAIRAILAFSGIDCGESPAPRRALTRAEHDALHALVQGASWDNLQRL